MKKAVLAVIITLIIACFGVVVLSPQQEPINPIVLSVVAESPSPEVFKAYDKNDKDITASVVVTGLENKKALNESQRQEVEDSVKSLSVTNYADEDTIWSSKVDIESIFYINITDSPVKYPVGMLFKLQNPDNFAALMVYKDGHFEEVHTMSEGSIISFEIENTGVFAVAAYAE